MPIKHSRLYEFVSLAHKYQCEIKTLHEEIKKMREFGLTNWPHLELEVSMLVAMAESLLPIVSALDEYKVLEEVKKHKDGMIRREKEKERMRRRRGIMESQGGR